MQVPRFCCSMETGNLSFPSRTKCISSGKFLFNFDKILILFSMFRLYSNHLVSNIINFFEKLLNLQQNPLPSAKFYATMFSYHSGFHSH